MGQPYSTEEEHGHVHVFKPSQEELRKLQLQFDDIRTSEGGTLAERLTKDVFKHNFQRVLKPQYIDRVFDALDVDHDGEVEFREFVIVTHILFAGTQDEKLDYLFKLYDTDHNGYLTQEELRALMLTTMRSLRLLARKVEGRSSTAATPSSTSSTSSSSSSSSSTSSASTATPTTATVQSSASAGSVFAVQSAAAEAKAMADKLLAEADRNHDGKISNAEFKAYATTHPEVLQPLRELRGMLRKVVREDIDKPHRRPEDDLDELVDRPRPQNAQSAALKM